ncbi:MAG: ligase-associated damage response exonuclease [Chitinophagaceae bacterium]|nr:ligase-associated damage response exonuclease [Chitinophagaceae bacterium]
MIDFTPRGLYCSQGGFHIDPWLPVDKAVITHAHGDHARFGNKHYLSHHFTKPLIQARLREGQYESIGWNEPITMNGVKLSFHPAGHMIGSSQVRLEYNGEVWVFSGDYKTEDDGISGRFEPVKCNTFITESTFGLPIYHWKPQQEIFNDIKAWIQKNKDQGKASVLMAYSLGKAQRILQPLSEMTDVIYAHGAVYNMQEALVNGVPGYAHRDVKMERITFETTKEQLRNAVILAPPSAENSSWMKRFQPYALGYCSGWMQVRGNVRRKNVDGGFAISDHADWNGLLDAVKATGATKVFVTHGYQAAFSRYLNEIGIESAEVKTEYGTEDEGEAEVITDEKGE